MKNRLIPLVQILLNIAMVPFYFINLFHESGVFEGIDSAGNFIYQHRDFYYSAYKNLNAGGYSHLLYFSLAMIVLSVVASLLYMILNRKRSLRLISFAWSAASLLTFIFSMLLASTVTRAY